MEEGSWRLEVLFDGIILDVVFNFLMFLYWFFIFDERNLSVYEILPSSEIEDSTQSMTKDHE
ncbi:hypothetical protein BBH99_17150 [Chryseobacterium contaminans]|uniref:Uncharacterized protein n=1 Tax=Chryseobacterium contaminans TaxID=1423959 RepID=A0ABX2X935_9FLAO|nr:hypothetical protein BBH99_17150 [Chryseobacterium contaminans]